MEISGIGGYRRRGTVARSSFTSADTALTDVARMMQKPPAPRSVGSSVAVAQVARGQQHNHRASVPIMLDFDLPSLTATAAQKQQQQKAKQQSKLLASSSRMKRRSTLRLDNLQPSVNMSDERRDEYKQVLEDRIECALLKSQAAWNGTSGIFDDDPKNWKLHVNKPDLTMYRRRHGSGSERTSNHFVASGRIPGVTLQDLEYGLYAETTPDERALNAYWYGEHFLDAGILESYETCTDDDPFHFFGVKWLLAGPLLQAKLVAPRVSSYVQFQKTVIDEFGEKVLVRVSDSVPEDIVPLIPDQGKISFVPLEFAIIYMYRYDQRTKGVQVFCEGHLKPTAWMPDVDHSYLASVIVHLKHIADAKYITKHGLMFPHETSPTSQSTMAALSVSTHPPSSPMTSSHEERTRKSAHLAPDWVPDKTRKLCFVCFKSFSLLRRRRHHCRMCGEVMCAECMVTLSLVAPAKFDVTKDANFPLTNQPPSKVLDVKDRRGLPVVHDIKFCRKCISSLRQERRAMTAGVGNYYFTEGMLHHNARMQAALGDEDEGDEGDGDDGIESGYLDSSLGEDESIVDELEYSLRIEKLRQEHMEREKQKLRDQHKKSIQHQNARSVSVRLLDDELSAVSVPSSSGSASRKQSVVSEYEEGVEEVSEEEKQPAAAAPVAIGEVIPTSLIETSELTTKATFSSAMPSTSSANNRTPEDPENTNAVPRESSLLPIDIRRRSFSIPDHFEMMERSIAEQEALITSIQQQRAQMNLHSAQQQSGGLSPSRLPIGEVMRSIAQSNPSVLATLANPQGMRNQAALEGEYEPAVATVVAAVSQPGYTTEQ
ncbi:1-phosphatidylinositol 3-phosphate 5-kinase [Globisporangium polare]